MAKFLEARIKRGFIFVFFFPSNETSMKQVLDKYLFVEYTSWVKCVCVCLGWVGILKCLLWVMVASTGLYSLYELISLILSTSPTRKGTRMSLGEWRRMEINLRNWGLVFESRSVHPKAWTLFTSGWWRLSLIAFSQSMIDTVPSLQDMKLSNRFSIPF